MKINILFLSILIICSYSFCKKLKKRFNFRGCIIGYEKCNYEGAEYSICWRTDNIKLRANPFYDAGHDIKSIQLGDRSRAYIYKGNFNGKNIQIDTDINCLKDIGWEDSIHTLTVLPSGNGYPYGLSGPQENDYAFPFNCARLWSECDLKGEYRDVCGDIDLWKDTDFNDKASSMQIGGNTNVYLYPDDNFNGTPVIYESPLFKYIECFDESIRGKVSSVRITNNH